MGDMSRNFNRSEFACRCGCGFDNINPELIKRLELAREHFGAPIIVSSGCRCPKRNRAVGGALNSKHVLGIAADIAIRGIAPDVVASWFEKNWPSTGGVGRYRTFTHVDVRPEKSRWNMVR